MLEQSGKLARGRDGGCNRAAPTIIAGSFRSNSVGAGFAGVFDYIGGMPWRMRSSCGRLLKNC